MIWGWLRVSVCLLFALSCIWRVLLLVRATFCFGSVSFLLVLLLTLRLGSMVTAGVGFGWSTARLPVLLVSSLPVRCPSLFLPSSSLVCTLIGRPCDCARPLLVEWRRALPGARAGARAFERVCKSATDFGLAACPPSKAWPGTATRWPVCRRRAGTGAGERVKKPGRRCRVSLCRSAGSFRLVAPSSRESDDRLLVGAAPAQKANIDRHGETLSRIADRLLMLGGETVVVPHDNPDYAGSLLQLVLTSGQTFDPNSATLEPGEANDCHANVVKLWRAGRGTVCSGFALSPDGKWRCHSWLRDHSGSVVETTVPRTAYFGLAFDDEAAELFADAGLE